MNGLLGSPILCLCFVSCPLPLFAFLLLSLLFLVFLVSRLLHPLSPVCCLRRLSPVPCCGSKKGSRRQSDLHAAPSHHTSLVQPRGMHNLRACRNSRHAEPRGVQNLDACKGATGRLSRVAVMILLLCFVQTASIHHCDSRLRIKKAPAPKRLSQCPMWP